MRLEMEVDSRWHWRQAGLCWNLASCGHPSSLGHTVTLGKLLELLFPHLSSGDNAIHRTGFDKD